MPYKLPLVGVRGDALLIAVPLTAPGPPVRPLTGPEAVAIQTAWPVIQMQVKTQPTDSTALLSLTAAAGELSIVPSYPQPDGTNAPVLLISASPAKTGTVISGVYDIQFSGPGTGPYTWLSGSFKLTQDVTT